MKKKLLFLTCLSLSAAGTRQALAQSTTPPPSGPTLEVAAPQAMPSDEQSYRRETVFGVNFNTQGGLIGGVNLRVARVLDERWLRFWSLEGVVLKTQKEEDANSGLGTFKPYKTNYAFALRPSFGIQRILFRKAADAGVQVNAMLSGGPTLGLLMPYYISYDYTLANNGGTTVRNSDVILDEQYDPNKHMLRYILDRGPLFSGVSQTKVVPGVHLRGGLSFEYGRYRDAVAGVEVGFLVEAYTKRLMVLSPDPATKIDPNSVNKQFYPSVYLTLYLGHRS